MKISIIVATHDRPVWLAECLSSIVTAAEGSHEDPQVIVVDDASASLAARSVARNVGADYFRFEDNVGVATALATGFGMATGTHTSFWGDDDVMLDNWFDLHRAQAEAGFDVVSSAYNLVGPNLEHWRAYVPPPVTLADLRDDIVAANDGSLVRRDLLKLRPNLGRAMMLDAWLTLAEAGAKFTTITEPTWLYRRHDANLGRYSSSDEDEGFQSLRREVITSHA